LSKSIVAVVLLIFSFFRRIAGLVLDSCGNVKKPASEGRRRASNLSISLAAYFRPWQSADMEVP